MQRRVKLLAPIYREHLMLLCNSQQDCDQAAIDSINEGLAEGQLCIYASVLNGDKKHLEKISAKINSFDNNVGESNLVIIDFKPYFQSALVGELGPFNDLKRQIEQLLEDRKSRGKNDKVLVFAEAAGALSEMKYFDKSINLERWWNDTHAKWTAENLKITIICPHPAPIINEAPRFEAKGGLSHTHTLTLEFEQLRKKRSASVPITVLIVEPESDIRAVYTRYLDKLGLEPKIVSSIEDAKEQIFSDGKKFDLIILDINYKDRSGVDFSKEIARKFPEQRIVFTTTYSADEIKLELETQGITQSDLLVKPFGFSSLLSALRPKTN
jgi:CheY-like chemotaxis protein